MHSGRAPSLAPTPQSGAPRCISRRTNHGRPSLHLHAKPRMNSRRMRPRAAKTRPNFPVAGVQAVASTSASELRSSASVGQAQVHIATHRPREAQPPPACETPIEFLKGKPESREKSGQLAHPLCVQAVASKEQEQLAQALTTSLSDAGLRAEHPELADREAARLIAADSRQHCGNSSAADATMDEVTASSTPAALTCSSFLPPLPLLPFTIRLRLFGHFGQSFGISARGNDLFVLTSPFL